jgi:chromosomal replication initiator protein
MISVAWALPPTYAPEPQDARNYTLQEIAREIADEYGISYRHLLGDRRDAHFVIARHHFMYRASIETPHNLGQIGRFCGNRDHSTIRYGIDKHKARLGL